MKVSNCERVNYTVKYWFPQGSGITGTALPLHNAQSNDNLPVITVPLKSVSLLEVASYVANVLHPSGVRA